MYEVKVVGEFSAAHFLRTYKGEPENLHGHNWKVEACVQVRELDPVEEIGVDYVDFKNHLQAITAQLDHINVNDHPRFNSRNCSSENIARFIYDELKNRLTLRPGVRISRVAVWETDKNCASFIPE